MPSTPQYGVQRDRDNSRVALNYAGTRRASVNASGLTVNGAFLADSNDVGALGASGTAWSDLFLASGGVVNFNAGDATFTHQAGDTQGKVKFDATLADAAMDDGYGVFEVNANLTGTTTSWVAASSAWVNINTATAGSGVMVASVNNGIYEASGGTVTGAYLAYGGRYQAILGDGDATRLAVFSLNVSGDTATSFLVVDSTDGKEVGYAADSTSDSSKVADIPFLMFADGTIRYIRLYDAAS